MPHRRIRDADLFYLTQGTGPPLLLLHGGLGTGEGHFRRQLGALAKRYSVIVPDFRGCGRSARRAEFGPNFYDEDAADMAELTGSLTDEAVTVVGFSDGGIVGLLLAARFPALVRSLVVIGGQAVLDDLMARAARKWLSPEHLPERWRAALARLHGEDHWPHLVRTYASGIQEIIRRGGVVVPTEALEHIGCPTLIAHGAADSLVPVHHAQWLAKNITGAELRIVPGGGHELLREHPEEMQETILAFLGGRARVGGSAPLD
jgi:valacyclovir hydrolase